MFGLFKKQDDLERLSLDLAILDHKLERTRSDLRFEIEKFDEYDSLTRAKFKALADHLGIEFRSHYNPHKYEIKVAEKIDGDITEITTNNQ